MHRGAQCILGTEKPKGVSMFARKLAAILIVALMLTNLVRANDCVKEATGATHSIRYVEDPPVEFYCGEILCGWKVWYLVTYDSPNECFLSVETCELSEEAPESYYKIMLCDEETGACIVPPGTGLCHGHDHEVHHRPLRSIVVVARFDCKA
jgi:hypothetical protein